jgi:hypothetical protein
MRKVPFFFGLFVLIFPLNWLRLYVLGEVPPSTNADLVLPLSLPLLVIAALLVWWGLPRLRQSYQQVPASAGGPLTRLGAAIREAREEAARRKLEEERRRQQELEQARSGTLAPVNPGAVVLQQGEQAFAAIPASLLEMRTVRYRGASTGVSVRVAKGVWLRQSGSRGTAEKGLVPVARGMLVATNRRLISAGDQKSAAVTLDKISSFEAMNAGLRFGDARKTYNFLMGKSQQQQVFSIIAERLLRERN